MSVKKALVIFSQGLPKEEQKFFEQFDVVIAPSSLEREIGAYGVEHVPLQTLVEPGSIYEAAALTEELSHVQLPDGSHVAKSFTYEGYELWWMNYQNLYFRFSLPYSQYRRLLEYVRSYEEVHFFEPPFMSLFRCYLTAYSRRISLVRGSKMGAPSVLPFGMLVQILLTLISIPVVMIQRKSILVSTGDKFETGRDHDFRMRYIYESLRGKKLPFVEFIRSLESTKNILQHAFIRKRPVIYTEAVTFVGRFLSTIMGGHRRARRMYGPQSFSSIPNPDMRFKLIVATQYLFTVYDDVISIRIMEWILRIIRVKAAIVPSTTERNFHTVLGCKLNGIPTVGILHGVASRHYNLYEFMRGFDGPKRMSVDQYGVWSEWWREYFKKHSSAYAPEQIFVSGPMRPIQKQDAVQQRQEMSSGNKIKVLFVSEVVAIPEEVIPYLDDLMKAPDFMVYLKFRATHDSFETWLTRNRPDIMAAMPQERILKGTMHEAIALCDITVGCQSTGVIEAVIQDKPFVFFKTNKWGDYFDTKTFDPKFHFFAESTGELEQYIRESRNIPQEVLGSIREKFFGDPRKNGSAWVVEQVEQYLTAAQPKKRITPFIV